MRSSSLEGDRLPRFLSTFKRMSMKSIAVFLRELFSLSMEQIDPTPSEANKWKADICLAPANTIYVLDECKNLNPKMSDFVCPFLPCLHIMDGKDNVLICSGP